MIYKNTSILFVGDAEIDEENQVNQKYDNFLRSDILKIGHHGSITSTSKNFLENVKPKYAIISVGEKNKFNHPSPKVLSLLDSLKINYFRTDLSGAIIFESDGNSWKKIDWRNN